MSPSYANYFDLSSTVSQFQNILVTPGATPNPSADQRAENMQTILLKCAENNMERWANTKCQPSHDYKPGDLVWLRREIFLQNDRLANSILYLSGHKMLSVKFIREPMKSISR